MVMAGQAYDESRNLQALETRFLAYQDDLAKLQRQVRRLTRDLREARTNTIRIGALQEAQADERDALISIGASLSLPFEYSQCECLRLDETQREEINGQARQIRRQLRGLGHDVWLQQRTPKTNAIRAELRRQLSYLNTVQEALNSDCCQPTPSAQPRPARAGASLDPSGIADISDHVIQTNLKAGQWIYGCLSKAEVRLRYFARTVHSNVTNCPEEAPFFHRDACIGCPAALPIWDLCTQQCIACPPGTAYSQAERSCAKNVSYGSGSSSWESEVVPPVEQPTETVAPLVGSGTLTIVTQKKTKTTTSSSAAAPSQK